MAERRRSSRAKLGLDLVDLTRDGNTTRGVIADLAQAPPTADVVTLTAGGNDLLGGDLPRTILHRLHRIAVRIQPLGARVVIPTIYDPSDVDNAVGRRELGLSRLTTIELELLTSQAPARAPKRASLTAQAVRRPSHERHHQQSNVRMETKQTNDPRGYHRCEPYRLQPPRYGLKHS